MKDELEGVLVSDAVTYFEKEGADCEEKEQWVSCYFLFGDKERRRGRLVAWVNWEKTEDGIVSELKSNFVSWGTDVYDPETGSLFVTLGNE